MKRTESLYRTAVLLLLLMLAAACTRDDTFDDAAPGNGIDPAAPLTITVTDGAYAPETSAANAATDDGAPVTRAVENGYATGFTKGDQIGLYVAKAALNNSGSPDRFDKMLHENLCLTYDGTTWTLPVNTELKYDPDDGYDIFYFAYYPYQADMNDKKPDGNNASGSVATEAPDFFHTLIGNWTPQNDQSTYAAYAASDLMVARGEVATRTDGILGSLLSFTMEHQMLLNIVRLPYITSTYTEEISGSQQTKSYYLYTGVAQLPNFWRENPHTARLITNPSRKTAKITGCSYYDLKFVKHEFDIEISDGVSFRGKYKTYTVDNATETKSKRTLQEGDFYMKDGTVLPLEYYRYSSMPENVKNDCLGVVFWVGEKVSAQGTKRHWTHDNGDLLLMHEHPGCTHGLVVALTDVSNQTIQWSSTSTGGTWEWLEDYPAAGQEEEKYLLERSESFFGYNMTRRLRWYRDYGGHHIEALDAIEQYAKKNATPAGCSGWYLIGNREIIVMANGEIDENIDTGIIGILNNAFVQAGGTKFKTDNYYWCSSDSEGKAYCLNFNNKDRPKHNKNLEHYVRAILAF